MKNQLTTLIYVRQSTYREESISLELQETACREHAQRHGYRVLDVISDPGVSGLQFVKRPGIRSAIERLEAHEAQCLLVWRWSRLSRRRADQAVIIDRIEKAGARVESALEPIDTTTAGGEFSREVLLAVAAFESRQKSEQWKEAQKRRIDLGLPPGGQPPFGYRRATPPNRGPAVPDPDTAPLVREMYDRFLRGHGAQGIARWLNTQDIRTTKGNDWTVQSAQRFLDSGFAAGYLHLDARSTAPQGSRHVPGAHEPLITSEVWDAYRQARAQRRQLPARSRSPRWSLSGIARCGLCAAPLVVKSYTAVKSQAVCSRYNTARTCSGVWINRHQLSLVVGLWLGGHQSQWATAHDATHHADERRADLARHHAELITKQERLLDGRRALATALALGEVTPEDHQTARSASDDALRALADELTATRAQLDALGPDADALERIAETASDDPAEFNLVLRKLLRRIEVTKLTVTVIPWHGPTLVIPRSEIQLPRDTSADDLDEGDVHHKQPRGHDGRFRSKPSPEANPLVSTEKP